MHFLLGAENFRQMRGKRGHGNNVQFVVFKNSFQKPPVALFEPVEVALRNFPAGNIAFAEYSQHLCLQRSQPAVFEAMPQNAPRRMQQIQMGKLSYAALQPVHNKAGGQKINIKSLAVESNQKFLLRGDFGKIRKRGSFFGKITRENLTDVESAIFKPAQAD